MGTLHQRAYGLVLGVHTMLNDSLQAAVKLRLAHARLCQEIVDSGDETFVRDSKPPAPPKPEWTS